MGRESRQCENKMQIKSLFYSVSYSEGGFTIKGELCFSVFFWFVSFFSTFFFTNPVEKSV